MSTGELLLRSQRRANKLFKFVRGWQSHLLSYDAAVECFRLPNSARLPVKCLYCPIPLVLINGHIDLLDPTNTAQAEQATSTPEPETTQAAVTPKSSYVATVSSYEAPTCPRSPIKRWCYQKH
jgi:hypothetical protein